MYKWRTVPENPHQCDNSSLEECERIGKKYYHEKVLESEDSHQIARNWKAV